MFTDKVARIVYRNMNSSSDVIDYYYKSFKEYVINYKPLETYDNIVDVSTVNLYDQSFLGLFKLIPLNNSLVSLNGLRPLKFSKKLLPGINKDEVFNYDSTLNRHVYSTNENELVYDLGLNNSATIIARVKLKSGIKKTDLKPP